MLTPYVYYFEAPPLFKTIFTTTIRTQRHNATALEQSALKSTKMRALVASHSCGPECSSRWRFGCWKCVGISKVENFEISIMLMFALNKDSLKQYSSPRNTLKNPISVYDGVVCSRGAHLATQN